MAALNCSSRVATARPPRRRAPLFTNKIQKAHYRIDYT